MNSEILVLFSRKGCCLCEALEKKLLNINLSDLNPSLILSIIDIDNINELVDTKRKYTNEVPVLVLDSIKLQKKIEFPRVPPRLKEGLLVSWIQKQLNSFYEFY